MSEHTMTARQDTVVSDDPGRHRTRELAVAGVALGGSVALVVLGGAIELRVAVGGIDPRWWPQTLGGAGIVLSVVLALQALAGKTVGAENEPATKDGSVRVGASLGLVIGYGIAWHHVDFRICTVVLLAALAALYGARGVKVLVLYPVLLTALLYLLFDLVLKVAL